jgi:hypothetical protein
LIALIINAHPSAEDISGLKADLEH